MKNPGIIIWTISIMFLFTAGCREKPLPKPHGYFRIAFPEKRYRVFDSIYPYKFDIPVYSRITQDTRSPDEPFWINIQVPENKADIHISYFRVENSGISPSPDRAGMRDKPSGKNLAGLIEDSREFVYKHTVKASSINEQVFMNPFRKVYGTIYFIDGNAASPMQFFITDSTANFMRGALYIREVPNIDSLRPVIEFLKTDLIRLIESASWKN